jgi:hypothetical protein
MTEYGETYLQGLISEIERIKARKGTGLFRINDKITNETAKYVKNYFQNVPGYSVDMRKCAKCKGTWDIIILFKRI